MELRQLEYFLAVEEERHFSRAADRANVVQSSLSGSIGRLERELGAQLFVRDSHRVELTESGRALLPAARRAVEAARDGRDAVAAVRGVLRGHLRVGAIQALDRFDLPAALARFAAEHPGVTFEQRNASVDLLIAATLEGSLDLAFVDEPFDARRLEVRALGSRALVLAVPEDHALAGRRSVALARLGGERFVSYRTDSAVHANIERACARAGLRRTIVGETDTMAALVTMVAAGAGVALLPAAAADGAPGVATLATTPKVEQRFSVVTAASRPPAPAAEAFLSLVTPG